MKNTRFLITAGTLVLGFVSVFATKPIKKFSFVTFGKFNGYSASYVSSLPGYVFTDTKTGNSKTVILSTVGGSKLSTLVTLNAVGGNDRIYYYVP